jgi:hypothetical protein
MDFPYIRKIIIPFLAECVKEGVLYHVNYVAVSSSWIVRISNNSGVAQTWLLSGVSNVPASYKWCFFAPTFFCLYYLYM